MSVFVNSDLTTTACVSLAKTLRDATKKVCDIPDPLFVAEARGVCYWVTPTVQGHHQPGKVDLTKENRKHRAFRVLILSLASSTCSNHMHSLKNK